MRGVRIPAGGRPGLLAALILSLLLVATPAAGHEKHKRDQAAAQQAAAAATDNRAQPATPEPVAPMPDGGAEERASMSTFARLLDWLGRLHPIVVHFPMAFFPAALFTAIVGRRRPAFAKPVQFLVVAGGLLAPVAMVLGWLDGGLTLSDTDPLQRVHRWLGTAIGFAGLALAVWAWRRPEQDRRPGMIWALAGITAAIVVQGWYGGALVHGAGHMDW